MITDQLRTLIEEEYPRETITDKYGQNHILYTINDGEVCSLRIFPFYDVIFFEYADSKDQFIDDDTTNGAELYVPDYPDIQSLYKAVVDQFNN